MKYKIIDIKDGNLQKSQVFHLKNEHKKQEIKFEKPIKDKVKKQNGISFKR